VPDALLDEARRLAQVARRLDRLSGVLRDALEPVPGSFGGTAVPPLVPVFVEACAGALAEASSWADRAATALAGGAGDYAATDARAGRSGAPRATS
jgi:hypothetical protein